jgi:phenylpropionate dioxygenase-like ring-hydroxylating dioxygenase large terminal subunit
VASYRGFVFASQASDGISLQEHLGHAAPYIDRFCDLSPAGRALITPSVLKTRYFANWKLVLDNAVDGYHPVFLHQAMFKSYRGQTPTQWYSDDAGVVNGSLGGGHAILDFAEQNRVDRGGVLAGVPAAIRDELERDYVRALAARLGSERAQQLAGEGYSNVSIFPNLQLIQQDVRTVEPVSVGESIVHNRAAILDGAHDEINFARIRQQTRAYGPAGVVTPDDFEIFERCQRAFATASPDWMLLSRGAWREQESGGMVIGRATDEVGHRGIWRHYRQVMSQPGR